jgi:hypothetical protein
VWRTGLHFQTRSYSTITLSFEGRLLQARAYLKAFEEKYRTTVENLQSQDLPEDANYTMPEDFIKWEYWDEVQRETEVAVRGERKKLMSTQREKELEFLLRESGKEPSSLLAEAVQEGIHLLYKKQVSEVYIPEKIDRKEAIHLLGASAIDQLDEAWRAVESDIRWGLQGE